MPKQQEYLPQFLVDLSNNGWIRLVAKVTSALLIALAVLAMTLIIGFCYLGLQVQVKGDRIYLGSIKIGQVHPALNSQPTEVGRLSLNSNYQTLGAHVTVEANAGFQNSGIYLNENDKVRLEPYGRVHLALRDVYNFIGLVKSLIAEKLPTKEYNEIKKFNPHQNLTQDNSFRRDWTGPDGEDFDSPDLNDCLLFPGTSQQKATWGLLLAQVMEKPGSGTADPFEVLDNNNLKAKNLIPVPSNTVLDLHRKGWLTFIINDAFLSPSEKLPSGRCKDYYNALKKASDAQISNKDNDHRIPTRSIPLVWYSDNIGAFQVIVRYVDK